MLLRSASKSKQFAHIIFSKWHMMSRLLTHCEGYATTYITYLSESMVIYYVLLVILINLS